jgi:hypothetical protein
MDALGTRAGHAVMIGAVIATPLIASVVLWRNGRWVFFITGHARPAVGACMALIGLRRFGASVAPRFFPIRAESFPIGAWERHYHGPDMAGGGLQRVWVLEMIERLRSQCA